MPSVVILFQLLRRQAMFNTLLTSALRSHKPLKKSKPPCKLQNSRIFCVGTNVCGVRTKGLERARND